MPHIVASVAGITLQQIELENPRTTIGRKSHNTLVLDSIVVSGDHCVLQMNSAGEVSVEDLQSTNGTHINGQAVKSRQRLRDNDLITIGNFSLLFVATPEPVAEAVMPSTLTMSLASLGFPGTSASMQAALELLSGLSAGLEVPLVKAVTTFGHAAGSVVAISHRRNGYYVAHMTGQTLPLLNGKPLASEATALAHGDVLNLAGDEMKFVLKSR